MGEKLGGGHVNESGEFVRGQDAPNAVQTEEQISPEHLAGRFRIQGASPERVAEVRKLIDAYSNEEMSDFIDALKNR